MLFQKNRLFTALCLSMALSVPAVSFATPTLQLDINGGSQYDTTTKSTIATDDNFILNAYLNQNSTDGFYYVSFALVSKDGSKIKSTLNDMGSFTIGSTTYDESKMFYGTPPLDANLAKQDALGSHGVFPSFFNQLEVNFAGAPQTSVHNVEDNIEFVPDAGAGSGMYYRQFAVDTSNLGAKYEIHFDLYRTDKACVLSAGVCQGNLVIEDFAPFSHDASSGKAIINDPGTGGDTNVPEPAPLAMLALGLLGLTAARKKRPA